MYVSGCGCGEVATSVNGLKKDLCVRQRPVQGKIKIKIQQTIGDLQGAWIKLAIYLL